MITHIRYTHVAECRRLKYQLQHLIKHPSSYLFRIKIPLDLQSNIGKKELRYSLRTGIIGEAKPKARLMAGLVQKLFRELREEGHPVQKLSPEEIQAIVNDFKNERLEIQERERVIKRPSIPEVTVGW